MIEKKLAGIERKTLLFKVKRRTNGPTPQIIKIDILVFVP